MSYALFITRITFFWLVRRTEKEGFEPSRRYQRPTPFPGEPLRPAWVLLQNVRYLIYTITDCLSSTFFIFFHFFTLLLQNLTCRLFNENGHRNCRMNTHSSLSGEGGIRTHAPLRTNGFQDRLVMTTSIPLHMSLYPAHGWAICILTQKSFTVNHYFHFFSSWQYRVSIIYWSHKHRYSILHSSRSIFIASCGNVKYRVV